jgi:hypothetical protein
MPFSVTRFSNLTNESLPRSPGFDLPQWAMCQMHQHKNISDFQIQALQHLQEKTKPKTSKIDASSIEAVVSEIAADQAALDRGRRRVKKATGSATSHQHEDVSDFQNQALQQLQGKTKPKTSKTNISSSEAVLSEIVADKPTLDRSRPWVKKATSQAKSHQITRPHSRLELARRLLLEAGLDPDKKYLVRDSRMPPLNIVNPLTFLELGWSLSKPKSSWKKLQDIYVEHGKNKMLAVVRQVKGAPNLDRLPHLDEYFDNEFEHAMKAQEADITRRIAEHFDLIGIDSSTTLARVFVVAGPSRFGLPNLPDDEGAHGYILQTGYGDQQQLHAILRLNGGVAIEKVIGPGWLSRHADRFFGRQVIGYTYLKPVNSSGSLDRSVRFVAKRLVDRTRSAQRKAAYHETELEHFVDSRQREDVMLLAAEASAPLMEMTGAALAAEGVEGGAEGVAALEQGLEEVPETIELSIIERGGPISLRQNFAPPLLAEADESPVLEDMYQFLFETQFPKHSPEAIREIIDNGAARVIPSRLYRASANMSFTRQEASPDEYLAAIIRHSSRSGGSAGEAFSLSESVTAAKKHLGKSRSLFRISTEEDPTGFRTIEHILKHDGPRLVKEKKLLPGTLRSAIEQTIRNLDEKEVFYVRGSIPDKWVETLI